MCLQGRIQDFPKGGVEIRDIKCGGGGVGDCFRSDTKSGGRGDAAHVRPDTKSGGSVMSGASGPIQKAGRGRGGVA